MKTPVISVIVPVYKAENYLHRCVDSLLAQTFTDFEVLLVDDGSPDRSGKICDEYAQKDKRIIVIHQENKGVSAARNTGLSMAKGEWINFVDSDDMLPIDSLYNMSQYLGEYSVLIGYIKRKKKSNYYRPIKNERILSPIEWVSDMMLGKIPTGPVAKLYKRDLFDDNTFKTNRCIVYGEDYLMNLRIANKSTCIKYIPVACYLYMDNESSVSHKFKFTMAYAEKLFLLLNDESKKMGLSFNNIELQVCYLNMLKHVSSSNCFFKNEFFLGKLKQIKPLRLDLKNLIWYVYFKIKKIW